LKYPLLTLGRLRRRQRRVNSPYLKGKERNIKEEKKYFPLRVRGTEGVIDLFFCLRRIHRLRILKKILSYLEVFEVPLVKSMGSCKKCFSVCNSMRSYDEIADDMLPEYNSYFA